MGACTFVTRSHGRDVQQAFRAAVEDAKWTHGHGGYTGTIAEKREVTVIGEATGWREAAEMANRLLAENDERIDDKWGPAGAIRVSDTKEEDGWLFFGWASS